jgi:hypothetical protein
MNYDASGLPQRPLSAADEELIELKLQLFARDYANRLGRDPMSAGLAIYRTILRGQTPSAEDFSDFVAMYPPAPRRGPLATGTVATPPPVAPLEPSDTRPRSLLARRAIPRQAKAKGGRRE